MKTYRTFVRRESLFVATSYLANYLRLAYIDNFRVDAGEWVGRYLVTVKSDRPVRDLPGNVAEPWEVSVLDEDRT